MKVKWPYWFDIRHWKILSVRRKFCHSTKCLILYHFVLCTWSQVGVILLTILDVYIYTDISLQVLLYVNKVGPYFNPHETYHYYQLPVCRPKKVCITIVMTLTFTVNDSFRPIKRYISWFCYPHEMYQYHPISVCRIMKRCVLPELLKIIKPIGPDQQEI